MTHLLADILRWLIDSVGMALASKGLEVLVKGLVGWMGGS